MIKKCKINRHCLIDLYEEKKLILIRQQVNNLYFKYGLSKSSIMEKEGVSKPFVIRWTQSPDQDFDQDDRGWSKGKARLFSPDMVQQVLSIHSSLVADPHNFFTGATAVLQEWRVRYPEQASPSLRSVGRILKGHGLTKPQKPRSKGAAAYLCYPEHTIYNEHNGRVLEADFIGKKYIHGRSAPINFIGFSFKKEPRLRYFERIDSQSALCFIKHTDQFFEAFETPQYIKVDNALAMIGSASGKRNISSSMLFLLNRHVVPIFAVPRKPFSQASIEGNNSVFARFFWNQREFSTLRNIDEELYWFNQSSLKYTGYKKSEESGGITSGIFVPEVMFIRQVKETGGAGTIDVLNESIQLESDYINYFVLARWSLQEEKIRVFLEKENRSELIAEFQFKLSLNSLKKIKQKGKLSFDL